jgi:hypothetical protein
MNVKDEMGGTCSAHGKDEKFLQNFGWKARRDHLEALGWDTFRMDS